MSKGCKAATNKTEELDMIPLHSLSNQGGSNSIYYSILLRNSQKELIIGFSGTMGTSQLITEILEAFPVSYGIHDVSGATVFDYNNKKYFINKMYFYAHYVNAFRDDLLNKTQEYLQKYQGYSLVFVGHSLGGALTIHAAADVILSGLTNKTDVYVYTYGQPRVGNPAFNDAWMPKVKEFYRLVHYRDLVSHIPPCMRGISSECYHDGILPFYPYHSPQEIFYDADFNTFKRCNETNGEDINCSDDIFNTSIDDHLHYFGIGVGQYRKSLCRNPPHEMWEMLVIYVFETIFIS